MQKNLFLVLAILSGSILVLPLISPLPGLLVFAGYVPLLYAEFLLTRDKLPYTNLKVLLLAFVCFSTVNLVSLYPFAKLLSYWIVLFSVFSAILSAVVFLLFSVAKRILGKVLGYATWIVFTVAFEFLSLNSNFSFPCLLAGALFFASGNVSLIQWYEYTGVLGGSVWILACNLLLFFLLKKHIETKSLKKNARLLTVSLACVLCPMIFSLYKYHTYVEIPNPVEFVVIQPNIDPYTEKFVESNDRQLDEMLLLAKQTIRPETDYVVFPETVLDGNIWLNNIAENPLILKIRDSLLIDYPRAKVIAGADMMQYYVVHDGKAPTPWAKKVDDKIYYDFFNAALQIDSKGDVEVYKKSKLVLGTEYIPLTQKYPQLERLIINLGGSSQGRGRQEKPSLLTSETASVASIICFESIFGEYVSKFVKLGGEIICIISNDGWWNPVPIPEKHFEHAQIRAIENRRSVVRCANTGISGFINQKGDAVAISHWWRQESMLLSVNKNTELTFYARYGDYVGRICVILSLLIFFVSIFRLVNRRKVGAIFV